MPSVIATFLSGHVRVTAALAVALAMSACGGDAASSAPGTSSSSAEPLATGPQATGTREEVALDFRCEDPTSGDPAAAEGLTGTYSGNDDGTYYLRQVGDCVWWLGMSEPDGASWTNVAVGKLVEDSMLELQWSDVPRGEILGGGTLQFEIQDDGARMVKVAETGTGFGGSVFERQEPESSPGASDAP